MSSLFPAQPEGQPPLTPEDLSSARINAIGLLSSLEETCFLLASCPDPLFAEVTSVPDEYLCDAIRRIRNARERVEDILASLSVKMPGRRRHAIIDQDPTEQADLSWHAHDKTARDEQSAYVLPLKKLQQDAIAYALTSVFRWEGQPADASLCNAGVLNAAVQHYATILDNAYAAGTLTDPAVLRLSEFLTEPSVRTFRAMAAEVPTLARWAARFRKDSRPEADGMCDGHEWPAPDDPAQDADDTFDEGPRPTAEEIVEFMRTHRERVVVIMLSRGGGFTHGKIAATFGISRSRCYRYQKWFEGLGDAYRRAIIAVGSAAAEEHCGSDQAFDITGELIGSYEAFEIIVAAQEQE